MDVIDRYYRAYLESLTGSNLVKEQILSKGDFWLLKQNRITDLEIGILSGLSYSEAKDSAELRKDLSFKHEYLELDKIFDDVYKIFEYLQSKKIIFYIVTLRRKKQLAQVLKQHKISKYISNERLFFLQDDQKIQNDVQEKYLLLVNAANKLGLNPMETWLVGDSDTDVHAARLARYGKIIAITRGIKSRQQLEILKPDHLIDSLNELPQILNAQALTRS